MKYPSKTVAFFLGILFILFGWILCSLVLHLTNRTTTQKLNVIKVEYTDESVRVVYDDGKAIFSLKSNLLIHYRAKNKDLRVIRINKRYINSKDFIIVSTNEIADLKNF